VALAPRQWAADLLHFWFHELTPADWWDGSEQTDAEIEKRFRHWLEALFVCAPASFLHHPQTVLAAVLRDASAGLLEGGRATVARAADEASALHDLISFHVDFALANADVIRVQDRELASLPDADAHEVRRLQREYVELWVGVLARLRPDRAEPELRIRAHAAFGLINSTPHSARAHGRRPADDVVRRILEDMAWSSLAS